MGLLFQACRARVPVWKVQCLRILTFFFQPLNEFFLFLPKSSSRKDPKVNGKLQ